MCGIAGEYWQDPGVVVREPPLADMVRSLAHRGPDGDGLELLPGCGLGHRRLIIVDPEGGAQPMRDARGELTVTFNGLIYNYPELRAALEARGHSFRTRCDTEVLLHGFREWGEDLPLHLNGMFAFAIHDARTHTLFAARDRLGKKPLHYHYDETAGRLLFGSEIKAVLAGLERRPRLRPESVAQFFCLRYVADPDTVFEGIHKLPPGHLLTAENGAVHVRPYWQLSFADSEDASAEELSARVLELLDDAVRGRLLSDVPLGAFLSGGVDSYAVVDAMARVSRQPVLACSIGFDDPKFDEIEHARQAARATGARLFEETVAISDMLEVGWFGETFDEPFADSSAIPTYHVSRMARRHVTVALSGDGGDESFAGYRRYRFDSLENRLRQLLPSGLWGVLGRAYPKADFLPRPVRLKRTLQNLARDPALAYARSVSACLPEEVRPVLRGDYAEAAGDPLAAVVSAYRAADGPDPLARAIAADIKTWLPGDVLVKVDRASMAVALEVRAPLLDYRLVELAARIPSAMKLRGQQTKGFLRDALRPRLGDEAMARSKRGFSVPLRKWMAGALGDALHSALAEDRLATVVDPARVAKLLAAHRSGRADHADLLWAVLTFDRFLARWA